MEEMTVQKRAPEVIVAEMVVKFYLTDEQMQKMKDLKVLCDSLGIMKSDSVEDLFNFMMMLGSAAYIDRRIATMTDMARNTEYRRKKGNYHE